MTMNYICTLVCERLILLDELESLLHADGPAADESPVKRLKCYKENHDFKSAHTMRHVCFEQDVPLVFLFCDLGVCLAQ